MIKTFAEYLKEQKVIKQTPNIDLANSLIIRAKRRFEEEVKNKNITEENKEFVFEDLYESLRESAQAILALNGYKPYSHEVIIAFLKENYDISSDKLDLFDDCRIIRNKLTYEAKNVSMEKVKDLLKLFKDLIPYFESILKDETR
ncbi:MAG: hypothetical protein PHF86_08830 [Candidatus Nanoarchaeia archaeon]|nr:hypothetical protein [Candidatus Nanoarchaeia archaeon]